MTEDVQPEPPDPRTPADPSRLEEGEPPAEVVSGSPEVLVGPGSTAAVSDQLVPLEDDPSTEGAPGQPSPIEVPPSAGVFPAAVTEGPGDDIGAAPAADRDPDDPADEAHAPSPVAGEPEAAGPPPTGDMPPEACVEVAGPASSAEAPPVAGVSAEGPLMGSPGTDRPFPAAEGVSDEPSLPETAEPPVGAGTVLPEDLEASTVDEPLADDGGIGGLTWDAIAVALATAPPIPADVRFAVSTAPAAAPPSGAVEPAAGSVDEPPAGEERTTIDLATDAPVGPSGPGDDAPAPDDWPVADLVDLDEAVGDEALSSREEMSDEVADFWYPPEPAAEPDGDQEPSTPPSPWAAAEDQELVGLRGLAADWAADARKPVDPRQVDGWQPDRRPRPWSRLTAPLAARWSTMRRGERVNVVLYALTGLSIIAMGLELLAGPDSPPTEVSTTPPPTVASPSTTVRPLNTTITFTIPTTPAEAPADEPVVGPTPTRPPPARVTPTVAPDPEPDPEPTTPTAQPTTPASAPPTTRSPPTTTSGFPEPTPPVLPTFPGPPLNFSGPATEP